MQRRPAHQEERFTITLVGSDEASQHRRRLAAGVWWSLPGSRADIRRHNANRCSADWQRYTRTLTGR
jgi:hypothetical protein